MALSSDVLSQFAKLATNKDKQRSGSGTIVNGTAVEYAGKIYVQLDGSDQLTPITSSTAGMKGGDRVTVMIKDHATTVTGNVSSPSVTTDEFEQTTGEIGDKITEIDNLVADTVTTDQLQAESARIDDLVAENVVVKDRLTATEIDVGVLEADNVTIKDKLTAAEADIDRISTDMLTAEAADIKYATIDSLEATDANIHNLEADYGAFKDLTAGNFSAVNGDIENLKVDKLDATEADLKYANIDFTNIGIAAIEELFSKSGIIGDLVVSEGHITGTLVGVTIKGDLIEGNTIKADKLVVLGTDGLYYKLNVNAESVAAEQTEYNSLNGSIITANTITAEKINVDDLVAFNATIGGFHITDSSLYSGAKASAANTTRGVFMGDDGQFAVGDSTNYLKFFNDNGTWKLQISANSIKMGASNQSIEDYVADSIEIGGTNLLRGSATFTDDVSFGSGLSNGYKDCKYASTTRAWQGPYLELKNLFDRGELNVGDVFTASIMVKINFTPQKNVRFTFYRSRSEDPQRVAIPVNDIPINTWFRVSFTLIADDYTKTSTKARIETDYYVDSNYTFGSGNTMFFSAPKIERGNKVTDWSPAPEDVQQGIDNAQSDATNAQNKADDAIDRVDQAESSIEILNKAISSLVTDENGSSLMTQTSSGWTFNIGGLQSSVEENANQIDDVIGDVSGVKNLAQQAKDLADDVAEKTAYINMTQDDNGDPCIELGRSSSPFKLRITNTSIDFMEDGIRIAYITNRQLYIQSSVVTDEMKIGATSGFIWKKRGNGNMGLRWEAN